VFIVLSGSSSWDVRSPILRKCLRDCTDSEIKSPTASWKPRTRFVDLFETILSRTVVSAFSISDGLVLVLDVVLHVSHFMMGRYEILNCSFGTLFNAEVFTVTEVPS
jgi:hypothetical protein